MTTASGTEDSWGRIHLSDHSGVPLWVQLKTQMEYAIATGAVPPGTKLPSVRGMAQRLGVAVDTVRQAYEALAQAGLVATHRGVGTFTTLPEDGLTGAAGADATWARADLSLMDMVNQGCDPRTAARAMAQRLALLHRGLKTVFVGMGFSAGRYAHAISRSMPPEFGRMQPVDINKLRSDPATADLGAATYAVTLVFHRREVEDLLGDRPIRVVSVMSQLETGVLAELPPAPHDARGRRPLLVARPETRPIYEQLLRTHRPDLDGVAFVSDTDGAGLDAALPQASVVLHTSAAAEAVTARAATGQLCVELRHEPQEKSVHHVVDVLKADAQLLLELQRQYMSSS